LGTKLKDRIIHLTMNDRNENTNLILIVEDPKGSSFLSPRNINALD
jgi:C4-type Zn-finger protein